MIKPAPRGTDAETIRSEILEKLAYSIGKDPAVAKRHDWHNATVLALRDRIIDRWMDSTKCAPTRRDRSGSITCRSNSLSAACCAMR